MTEAVWFIQSNGLNQILFINVRECLMDQSIHFVEVNLKPFSNEIPDFSEYSSQSIVCWGAGFVPRIYFQSDINPGIWFKPEKFKWSRFYENWRALMLSSDGEIGSWKELVATPFTAKRFVRPNGDNKYFEGGVYRNPYDIELAHNAPDDFEVVVASAIPVENEWRFFIVDKTIISESSYRLNGAPNIQGIPPTEAIEVVSQAISIWCPDDVFCIDIGFDGQRYGIVEANCFNASRHYGADTRAIISAINNFLSLS